MFHINKDGIIIKITLFIYAMVILFCFLATKEPQAIQFNFHNLKALNANWNIDGQVVSLPFRISSQKNTAIQLQNQLPAKINAESILCFPSVFCQSRVFIDQEERYRYGDIRQLPFGNMVGDRLCIVPIYPEDAEKEIIIELIPSYSTQLEIPLVRFGTRTQLLCYIIIKNAWKVAICSIFATFIIISLITALNQKRIRGRVDKVGIFKSYAMFTFNGMVWLISSSELPQLFTDASEAVTLLSYASLAFFAVPYAYFCEEIFQKGKIWFRRLYWLGCFITLLIIVLYLCNLADPYETLWLSHVYLILMMCINFYYIYIERKTNPLVRQLKSAIIILGIFGAIGFEQYYRKTTSGYDALAFGIGFMIFSAFLFSITVTENEKMLEEVVRLDIYKELAYKDAMTQLGNRAAFDNALKFIIQNASNTEKVALIIFDLNNLKKVNDGIGHQAGDEMIKGIASCIDDTFQSAGKSYRIGGDEFATILIGTEFNIPEYFAIMDKLINDYNAIHTYPITTARGYVMDELQNITKDSIASFIQRADDAMYQNKKMIKSMME